MDNLWGWVSVVAICLIFLSILFFSEVLKTKSIPDYMPRNNDVARKLDIELAKFLIGRGLAVESVTQYEQRFAPLQGAIKLAIFDAIQSLPSDSNLEEELSKLIVCGQYYPEDPDEILLYHIPFCNQYLATIRPLNETEKQSVRKLIESIMNESTNGVTDQFQKDLISLLQTLTPDQIGQENPEEKPIGSSESKEKNQTAEIPPFELEMRQG